MANARKFFEQAISSPGTAPVVAPGFDPDDIDNAPELSVDMNVDDADVDVNPVDLSEHRSIFTARFADNGWDAIAFYAPFHHHGRENWGVYFVGDPFLGAVDAVQSVMSSAGTQRSQAWIAAALFRAVHVHELVHFAVELAATHAETITGSTSLYQAYIEIGRASVLREPALTEEAVATAREIRRARRVDRSFATALGVLSEGLPGYGDFARYLGDDESGRRVLLSHLVGSVSTSELLGEHVARPYHRYVPVYWLPPRYAPAGLDDLLPRIIALPLRRVLDDARRRPGVIVNERSGGDHPTKIEKGKQFVPVSLNWDRVPHDVVKQIANLFDLKPGDYCAQVLNKRLRPRRA